MVRVALLLGHSRSTLGWGPHTLHTCILYSQATDTEHPFENHMHTFPGYSHRRCHLSTRIAQLNLSSESKIEGPGEELLAETGSWHFRTHAPLAQFDSPYGLVLNIDIRIMVSITEADEDG